MSKKRILVAITGASGAILGIRLLQELRAADVEVHLILSDWAKQTIAMETVFSVEQVQAMADVLYDVNNLAAAVSSGSCLIDAMAIVPCSMKSLSAIANGFSYNLITRAADVSIKEHRPLLIMPRETPLSSIHLRNMTVLTDLGVIMVPPCIGFYTKPKTLDDVINHLIGKMLDELKIEHEIYPRWKGTSAPS